MPRLLNLLARLPLPALHAISYAVYLLLYYVLRYRRSVVKSNIAHALPHLDTGAQAELGKTYYRHLSRVLMEVVKSVEMPPDEFRQRIRFKNPEVLLQPLQNQQSVLLLINHQGHWEWLIHAVTLMLPCPLEAIYKPLHNDGMEVWIKTVRTRFGSRLIPFREAGRQVLKSRGQLRVFALAGDQVPSGKDLQYWRPFMGRDAAFFFSTQKLAEATQYPLIYARMLNDEKIGHYSVEFFQLGQPPYEKNDNSLIERYIDSSEQSIKLQPHSWLWSNRKWKRTKPGPKAVFSPDSRFAESAKLPDDPP
jgi:KDO2-lipid IV(A) lauroyltransferase